MTQAGRKEAALGVGDCLPVLVEVLGRADYIVMSKTDSDALGLGKPEFLINSKAIICVS